MDQVIAAQVGGIDLVIGGHSHTFLYGNGSVPGPLLYTNTTPCERASVFALCKRCVSFLQGFVCWCAHELGWVC